MECNDDRDYRAWMFDETLNCFEMMKLDGIVPDSLTFICGLLACHSKGAIDKG